MPRDNSPFILGDFWLDKRPDGRSDAWHIAWYDPRARTVRYKSTRRASLEQAKESIGAHYLASRRPVEAQQSEAIVGDLLARYYEEYAIEIASAEQIRTSIQHFTAFLEKEENAGLIVGATKVSDLIPRRISRFIEWRSGPHTYRRKNRKDETVKFESNGVSGESINRNIDDVRAAIRWAWKNHDIASAPFIAGVPPEMRSPPRDRVLSLEELGKILNYGDELVTRLVVGILATGARPQAVLAWNIPEQADFDNQTFDTNPPGKRQTKKYNATVPVCSGFLPWLESTEGPWIAYNGKPVTSIKRRWRTMRKKTGLGMEVVPKTIRHTVATWLQERDPEEHGYEVPGKQISLFLGHRQPARNAPRSTWVYTHVRPARMATLVRGLDDLWEALEEHTKNHLRTTCGPQPMFAFCY